MVFHTANLHTHLSAKATHLSAKSALAKSSKIASKKTCGSVKSGFNYTIKDGHGSVTYGSDTFSVVAKYGNNPLSGNVQVNYCPYEGTNVPNFYGGITL